MQEYGLQRRPFSIRGRQVAVLPWKHTASGHSRETVMTLGLGKGTRSSYDTK